LQDEAAMEMGKPSPSDAESSPCSTSQPEEDVDRHDRQAGASDEWELYCNYCMCVDEEHTNAGLIPVILRILSFLHRSLIDWISASWLVKE
jgi:hypothetical protein